ncbi:MAG TPA: carbonic anhydrase [Crenotrichaceae bacterium]|nr:carbonic anhydrase [Crenotrichaceae bacterium]
MQITKHLSREQKYPGVFSNLKDDFSAGFVVFLVALPLCLGIALASGAPLYSGLIAGIVGGLVVTLISDSQLGVSGPAAGLTVLVFSFIQELGFEVFLLVLVVAGLFQIALGLLNAGIIGYYFPTSVITGMLSGIGIILILKQIPHAFGYDMDYEGDQAFHQHDDFSTITELAHMLNALEPGAVLISSICLMILLIWERPRIKQHTVFGKINGSMMAVVAGVALNLVFQSVYPQLALSGDHLVQIPIAESFTDFIDQFSFPAFSQIDNPAIYIAAATIGIVASLETLLCVEATDKLDPYRRVTPTNRELVAQGVANTVSGMIGGLPVTQVIVRSSANIQAGGRTKASAFIHGLLLLIAVMLIPGLLNLIPLSSLAAVLLVVGYKLARPEVFKRMFQVGLYHFIPFLVTIVGLVFTDLLTGIAIGFATALFSILLENYKTTFYMREAIEGEKTFLRLSENVTFLNKANIMKILDSLPNHSEVTIDATRTRYIDYDVYEIINSFRAEAELKNIKLTTVNLENYGIIEPMQSILAYTRETRDSLTPEKALSILKKGNQRFVNNLKSNRNLLQQANETRTGQFPIAIILSCIDSRTSVELIFDLGLGDVFSARIAGNIVDDNILGSMEFACKLAGSKLVVVLGHSHCGAVKGACDNVKLDHLSGLLQCIKPAVDEIRQQQQSHATTNDDVFVQKVAEYNVTRMVQKIRSQSAVLAEMENKGEIRICGGMHDIETGQVWFYDQD